MRILAITNMYPISEHPTHGTFVEQQIRGLKRIGLSVEVIVIDRISKGMAAYFGVARQVRAAKARCAPDIIHSLYGGVMAEMVTRAAEDVPTVVSFCGDDLLGELLSGPVRRIISQYGVLASYRAAKRADGIVVKSKNLRDALPEEVPDSKIRIIPNGVDLERFKPMDPGVARSRLGWRPECLNVLFPANTGDPRKRPELARAAVNIAESNGLSIELHQLRGVPHPQVPIWLNASDVVLLTSLHEGSPNIIKEALACNIPVVSVDVGDVSERLRGVSGCHIADAEPNDLARKLQLVSRGSGRVDSRCKVEDLSLERIAVKLKEFYDEVLSSRQGQRTMQVDRPRIKQSL